MSCSSWPRTTTCMPVTSSSAVLTCSTSIRMYVLAHSWSALIDVSGAVTNMVEYPVATDAPRAPDRFRSMLFDGWGDDDGGVIRTSVLRRIAPYDSYHFADRVFMTELGLHGPFYQVPDWLWFRRQHPEQAGMYAQHA